MSGAAKMLRQSSFGDWLDAAVRLQPELRSEHLRRQSASALLSVKEGRKTAPRPRPDAREVGVVDGERKREAMLLQAEPERTADAEHGLLQFMSDSAGPTTAEILAGGAGMRAVYQDAQTQPGQEERELRAENWAEKDARGDAMPDVESVRAAGGRPETAGSGRSKVADKAGARLPQTARSEAPWREPPAQFPRRERRDFDAINAERVSLLQYVVSASNREGKGVRLLENEVPWAVCGGKEPGLSRGVQDLGEGGVEGEGTGRQRTWAAQVDASFTETDTGAEEKLRQRRKQRHMLT